MDRHFTAFLTDASTNRTGQRKFDIRISRDPLHIYVAKQEHAADVLRLYVTINSPDGDPAITNLEVVDGSAVLASGKTNRFGIVRVVVPDRAYGQLAVRASAPNGASVREALSPNGFAPDLWLDTNRSLYRRGETIRCHIAAKSNAPVLLWVWNHAGETLYSRSIVVTNGVADATIPYYPRFRRDIAIGAAQGGANAAARTIIFPGQDALEVRATPAKPEYRPGETATVAFRASSEAALGIAVVDESVLERAATDSVKRRRRFDFVSSSAASLGGLTVQDLFDLDPAKIDDDLQLVAAALLGAPAFNDSDIDLRVNEFQAFHAAIAKSLKPVKDRLDANYRDTLSYPRDSASFFTVLGNTGASLKDPWMQAYQPRFTTEGPSDIIRIMSSGPDKRLGTADDFCALEIRFKWFAKIEAIVHEILHKSGDSPATPEEFLRELEAGGIRFDALRDPWGDAMHVIVANDGPYRLYSILSDGPDRKSGTHDDFAVANFLFQYFSATSVKMQAAIDSAPEMPRTADDLRRVLRRAGIDFDSLRDPWGHPYHAGFRFDETFTDDIRLYTYSEYNGVPEQRKQITPVKRKFIVIEIRSSAEDGVAGTDDDFAVASFRRLVDEKSGSASIESTKTSTAPIAGTGTLEGVVTDPTGAIIPSVTVTLDDVYVTRTGENGVYYYRAIKPGTYKLRFESQGFRLHVVDNVPVQADHVTRADATLTVGAVSETVEVAARNLPLMTDTASIVGVAAATAISTPRVREYFPETLYWQPELVTDRSGDASIRVKLADSITTWRVAVIASTVDGRVTETSAAIRAFQPFMADLDMPQVLTAGDEIGLPVPIRNYLDREQTVKVSAVAPPQIALREPVSQPGQIAASASADSVLHLRAEASADNARLRVIATANAASDAIEKPVSIHPDGQRRELTLNAITRDGQPLRFELPSNAIAGSVRAEVKFYPSLLARILESIEAVLQRPYGCGEQTISAAYPNLLFLRAMKQSNLKNARLEAKAMKNLGDGYRRLLAYQDDRGGFTYWGHGEPEVPLTAYALRFLHDAKEFIEVDDDRITRAQHWLAAQPSSRAANDAMQLEALAELRAVDIERRLGELARQAAEFDDPYAIANFAIGAMEAGNKDAAKTAIDRLCRMAEDEKGAAYWSIRANTPFHGWGRWGQVETTGLVVSALAKWRHLNGSDARLDALIDRGVLFLLQNADSSGSWATTQAAVRSLDALISVWAGADEKQASVQVLVNGVSAGTVSIPVGNVVRGPVTIDITRLVRSGAASEISFAGAPAHAMQLQVNAA